MPGSIPTWAAEWGSESECAVNTGTWLIVFVGAFVVGLIGLFLYGWLRRKEKPPPGVKPLKDDDDDWGH